MTDDTAKTPARKRGARKTADQAGAKTKAKRKAATPATKAKREAAPATEAKRKAAAPAAPERVTTRRGPTAIHLRDADDAAVAGLLPLVDDVNARGRVTVRTVTRSNDDVLLSMVPTGTNDPAHPGLILAVDPATGATRFDHADLGHVSADLIDAAGHAALAAVRDGDVEDATPLGWHADWHTRATAAAMEASGC